MDNVLAHIRATLPHHGADALVITHLPHVRWLSGFTGTHGLIYIDSERAVLVTDSRYKDQVVEQVIGFEICIDRDLPAALSKQLNTTRRQVAYQPEHMTMLSYDAFTQHFPTWTFVRTEELLDPLVAVKSDEAVANLARAQEITDTVFGELLTIIKPGVTEKELAAEIVTRQLAHGADGIPEGFWPIVATGVRTALPHAEATDAKIKDGDVVLLDFGCLVNGYTSDMTRTIICGKPSSKVREVYDVVLRAQSAAIEQARSGMTGSELDAIARKIITKAGYGEAFGHSLGHGVGLEIHEWPIIGRRGTTPLPERAVVTIEPGIYLPGEFGVRIEDMVVLDKGGCRNLTKSPKELITTP